MKIKLLHNNTITTFYAFLNKESCNKLFIAGDSIFYLYFTNIGGRKINLKLL